MPDLPDGVTLVEDDDLSVIRVEEEFPEQSLLKDLSDAVVKGDLVGYNILKRGENVTVHGDVSGEEEKRASPKSLAHLSDSTIHGDVEGGRILYSADNVEVYGDIEASVHAMSRAQDSTVHGDVTAKYKAVSYSEGNTVRGDVVAKDVLKKADDNAVYGDIVSKTVMERAKDSVVVSNNIDAEKVGKKSERSVLAAKDGSARLSSSIDVITPYDGPGLRFFGDWEELAPFFQNVDRTELFTGLELFDLEGSAGSIEELEETFERLKGMYDEVRDEHDAYMEEQDRLSLPDVARLTENNGELYQRLREGVEGLVVTGIARRYDLDEENAGRVYGNDHDEYLLRHREQVEDWGFDRFLKEFSAGSETYVDLPGFTAGRHVMPEDGSVTEEQLEATERWYDEGRELLEDIREGKGRLSFDDETYDELVDELEDVGDRADAAFREGDQERGQELVDRKHDIEEAIEERRQELLDQVYDRFGVQEDEPPVENVQEAMNQLWQEYMEPCEAREQTRQVAEGITMEADDVSSNALETTVWDKDLDDLPTYDTYNCCIFPGGVQGGYLVEMMKDPATQFLRTEIGDKEAMSITARVEDVETGEEYLAVNSVESSSNALKREAVSMAVADTLESYAEEAGLDGVIYNPSPNNTAPQQFVDNLDELYTTDHHRIEKQGRPLLEELPGWLETSMEDEFYRTRP